MDSTDAQITANPDDIRNRIYQLDGPVQASLKSAEELIANMSQGKNKGSKKVARKVVSAANQVTAVLEGLAELHPVAKTVVTVFKAIIKLELDRRDNNAQIAVTCHSMTRMMSVIRYLADVVEEPEDAITEMFQGEFAAIEAVITDFGQFSLVYYKYKQSTFRLCFSGSYKERLSGFFDEFSQRKQALEDLLSYRTARTIHETRGQVEEISSEIKTVISMLGNMTEKENKAMEYIARYGGPEEIVQNDALLSGLADFFGEEVTGPLKRTIQEDLDRILQENYKQSAMKIEGAAAQITNNIFASRDAILQRLDMGPYQFIEDEDVQKVWKDSEWKMSVKCRVFVDALHDHFVLKFQESRVTTGLAHPDEWTLNVLSKIMYHGPIGDAIDTDGSGFVSVREVNRFTRACPSGWTFPQWLAFWAVGWLDNNIQYHGDILDIIEAIEEAATSCPDDCKEALDDYRRVLHFVRPVIMNSIEDGAEENYDPAEEGFPTLDLLRAEFMQLERNRITETLEPVDWRIEDDNTLISAMMKISNGQRIELLIMSLLTVLLEHHRDVVLSAQTETVDEEQFEAMGQTLLTVFYTFNSRMVNLIRGWKQQRKEVSLQINCFAGGLYSSWYEDTQKPNSVLGQLQRLWSSDTSEHVPEPDKIDQLMERVAALEKLLGKLAELATIEDIRKIVNSNGPSAAGAAGNPRARLPPQYADGQGVASVDNYQAEDEVSGDVDEWARGGSTDAQPTGEDGYADEGQYTNEGAYGDEQEYQEAGY
ncbi:hypothetical protein PLICRDRAFT_40189 [Plicaturopsis crispa FD-325 SS-3]|nr:hypothetical protein PLICRDRAFT_40189 [Plicaturopsis crispa FD-325 SS-3]